jgi:HEAT repeat protein
MENLTVAWAMTISVAWTMAGSASSADAPPSPPDLTRRNTIDRELTYNLGATGLRGWIYTKPANFFESCQGRTTTSSRQILVTHVGKNSPADGVMEVDDVILGVDGKKFTDDARIGIAKAIQDAEKEEGGGILKLIRWRAGKTEDVQLKLRILGTYGDTAPYDCPKSKRILDEACRALEKEPLTEDLWGAVNGLALMATGNPDCMPKVREFARTLASASLKSKAEALGTWECGYRNLFLCEYHLLTGDREVLGGIRELTVALARGQSMYGTFGHGFAERTPEGRLHGSIPPYGPVNAAGLIGNLAIVLGDKCGVKDPEIRPAIDRACRYFSYYVDKGAIPYGEHEPWPYHENNGKNAMTAVLFALQGACPAETRFFAKMVTASYENREYGHTGQGFSYLWGALGANAGGPDAAAAFFREASWHFDLVRRCDGSFTYDGDEQYGPGKTDDDTYYGRSSYYGLSPTASYVLTYSIPLRKLSITGRDANRANWLDKKDVAEAVASGRFDVACKKMSTPEIVAALGDWSPIVRGWAAEELARRPEANSMAVRLIAMAGGKDVHAAQGACQALGSMKCKGALPALIGLLSHHDRWLRFKAAEAIKMMGREAAPAMAEILKAVIATAEPSDPINWGDSVQLTHGQLAAALFEGGLRESLAGADPDLLRPVIRILSRNADGMARAKLRGYFEDKLSPADVEALAPDLLAAVENRCPADTMFGSEIRMGALRALTKYHYKEGIRAAIVFAKTQGGHGSESRTGEIMKELERYGSAAREALPALRELILDLDAQCQRGEFPAGELNDRRTGAVKSAIEAIEAATTQPELRFFGSPQPGAGRKN